ncbi:segregation/condensation protein A [Sporosarcina sp. P37]|uniref:segregation/condensation protein A n=1 Tax=unclassified Sporosarcina TaxID=2647733 RepID=UPI0009BCB0DD|nr:MULTISPECIES: segregation/condensation protein A [unclassified Sporosarcina]ARD49418.1 segregation and condensation protein A [Sporosarcina sp. P33]ARK25892.1 segregation/condensation protein A [Sporosarcina sp. P37]PID18287.1 segregation/condensation protein A [Sporosarcina sp. P35]
MSYSVKLEVFEGPLDLLLHLINRLEIDIYDIPMAELTQQYIEHLHAMRVLQLDELSEYLVLAATLLEIKSKMLLPVNEEETFIEEFGYEEDPREELIARLVEYRKYKEAAHSLRESAAHRDEHFTKEPEDLTEYGEPVMAETEEQLNVFDLIGAFQKMLHRKKLRLPLTASITKSEQSVGDKMSVIMSKLELSGGECEFHALFDTASVPELVLTFLSLLELMKLQEVTVRQSRNFEELRISLM